MKNDAIARNVGQAQLYRVNDIYPCIQGEGVHAGVPMVMLRLHGCDVGCPFCDTRETWVARPEDRRKYLADVRGTNPLYCEADAAVIADYLLRQYDPGPTRVLLSGGEPAQQPLRLLVDALHDAGYQVHLETSGTATGHLGASVDWICLSPKIGMPGGLSLARAACEVADELTWPIGKEKDLRQLRAFLVEMALKPNCVVGIQPLSQNSKATTLCIEACLRHGWRLSVQTHKYLELR